MTATSTTTPGRIDASCRMPLFTLFGGAAIWLALSSVFGLIASLSFHGPAMFADCALLSYGRAYPAWSCLLVYGFCIPAGMGVGLWLLARLGRAELAQPFLITVAAKLWHGGVLVGLIAVLNGQMTGYEWFELPRYATVMLLLAFVLMAIPAFITYSRRTETSLYPSQWFVLAALFWLPWILSSAMLLLQFYPVRGVVQGAIAWWFAGNLLNVWLSLMGLAAVFYVQPKILGRPLQSQYYALFVFWTLILFGTWTGIPAHAPLPAWMTHLSAVANVMAFLPAITVVAMLLLTARGGNVPCRGGSLCYVTSGGWGLALSSLLLALTACPQINLVTDFTWFGHGQTTFRLYGFFAMTMFGAIYHILPQLTNAAQLSPGRVRLHFYVTAIGVLLFALPLLAGGVMQGFKLLNPELAFVDVAKSTLMPFRLSTLGETLLLLGSFLFLFNVLSLVVRHYLSLLTAAYADATALHTAGVKS